MVEQTFVIKSKMDGLNEYTKANRSNRFQGNAMKKKNENMVFFALFKAQTKKVNKYPVALEIRWYEPNQRRDFDNITFSTKFILDGMVKFGTIENDGQKQVNKISHEVLVDSDDPRIEVTIIEGE